jgi:hypothetical protein
MSPEEKIQTSSMHSKELDAPFETFEHKGIIYHQVGLMQAWVRGYTDPNQHMTTEPPQWDKGFLQWLTEHQSSIEEFFVGPPTICFPNNQTADAFRKEWHEKARERYPYDQVL